MGKASNRKRAARHPQAVSENGPLDPGVGASFELTILGHKMDLHEVLTTAFVMDAVETLEFFRPLCEQLGDSILAMRFPVDIDGRVEIISIYAHAFLHGAESCVNKLLDLSPGNAEAMSVVMREFTPLLADFVLIERHPLSPLARQVLKRIFTRISRSLPARFAATAAKEGAGPVYALVQEVQTQAAAEAERAEIERVVPTPCAHRSALRV